MRALLRFLGVIVLCATGARADEGPCISVPDPNGNDGGHVEPIMAPGYSYPDTGFAYIIYGGGPPVHDVCGVNRYQVNPTLFSDTLTSVSVQWSDLAIGTPGRIAIWQANGANFTNATLVHQQNVTVQGNMLGTYSTYQLTAPVVVSGTFYVGFSASTDPVFTSFFLAGRPAPNYVRGTSYFVTGPTGMNLANLGSLTVDDVADVSTFFGPSYFLIRANSGSGGFTYQGELKSEGSRYTGTADMKFQLFRSPTGTDAIDGQPNLTSGVSVNDGRFTVNVPADPRTFIDNVGEIYIEISVRTTPGGAYTTLSPRQRMASTPTALAATYANTVSSVPWTAMSGSPDVFGRLQIRGESGANTVSPGVWLSSPPSAPVGRAFMGLFDDNNIGFYGNNGAGWGVTMNTASGYVGFGTQSPVTGASKFDINTGATSGNYGGMYMVSQAGGWPFYGFSTTNNAAWMYFRGTDSTWRVYNAGEQLILTSTGLLSVGTGVASSAGYRVELPNLAGPGGQGRANAWVTYSSREYKENIKTLENPLDTIDRLRGVTFDWRALNADGTLTHDVGFIAEEIADVLPELVTRTADGKATGLDYGRVVPVAVEAIKAQRKEVAELRARLDAIEAAMSKMQK